MALIYPQNGDLKKLLKSSRKKVPQSARLSAGGGAKAKRAMPKCPQHEFEECFPNIGDYWFITLYTHVTANSSFENLPHRYTKIRFRGLSV